ncbi:hypothetical protein D3C77_329870 [compost metagenome]
MSGCPWASMPHSRSSGQAWSRMKLASAVSQAAWSVRPCARNTPQRCRRWLWGWRNVTRTASLTFLSHKVLSAALAHTQLSRSGRLVNTRTPSPRRQSAALVALSPRVALPGVVDSPTRNQRPTAEALRALDQGTSQFPAAHCASVGVQEKLATWVCEKASYTQACRMLPGVRSVWPLTVCADHQCASLRVTHSSEHCATQTALALGAGVMSQAAPSTPARNRRLSLLSCSLNAFDQARQPSGERNGFRTGAGSRYRALADTASGPPSGQSGR